MHFSTMITLVIAATAQAYVLDTFSAVQCGGEEQSFTLSNNNCHSLAGKVPSSAGVPDVTFSNNIPCTLFLYSTDDCTGTQATATQQNTCVEPGFDILSTKCVILT